MSEKCYKGVPPGPCDCAVCKGIMSPERRAFEDACIVWKFMRNYPEGSAYGERMISAYERMSEQDRMYPLISINTDENGVSTMRYAPYSSRTSKANDIEIKGVVESVRFHNETTVLTLA